MVDILPTLRQHFDRTGNRSISPQQLRELITRRQGESAPADELTALRRLSDVFVAADTDRNGTLEESELEALAELGDGDTTALEMDDLDAIHPLVPPPPVIRPTPANVSTYISSVGGTVLPQAVTLGTISLNDTQSMTSFIGRDNRLHILVHPHEPVNNSTIQEYTIALGSTRMIGRLDEYLLRNGISLEVGGRYLSGDEAREHWSGIGSGRVRHKSAEGERVSIRDGRYPASTQVTNTRNHQALLRFLRERCFNGEGQFTIPTGPHSALFNGLVQRRESTTGLNGLASATFSNITAPSP